MPEHDEVPREEPTGSPGPRIDPAMLTAGGPGKSVEAAPEEFMERVRQRVEAEGGVLLPGRTYEEADMARAALAALRGWPKQRDRLPADRADLMAAAWWSGHRNVAELARSADVSRDTVYEDLRARGIEPTDKAAAADPRSRYAPLTAEAVGGLAALSKSVTLPAMLVQDPDELPLTAWALSNALERIADLLDPDSGNMRQWGRDEVAHDLAARLQSALHHAHAVAADGVSERQLAGRALNCLSGQMDDEQYVVEAATVRLFHPDGDRVTVRIGQAQFSDFAPAGWTLLDSDRPLRELTGAEHLAIRAALDTIAETLHGNLVMALTELDDTTAAADAEIKAAE
ncbi:hypothetical protein ACIO02_27090 [Streptomyces sp. NPDC087568]|uniref:hypothetical protein n=1 Tax=unclassified Streptomyces TaxID=2593676 RepID=UPI0037F23409